MRGIYIGVDEDGVAPLNTEGKLFGKYVYKLMSTILVWK